MLDFRGNPTNVAEYVGPASRHIHYGMTSSDILDTTLSYQMKASGEVLMNQMLQLKENLKIRAIEHKNTVCIGRSHGIHAEPTTMGLKFALWYEETNRNIKRLQSAIDTIRVGQISGAVGTFEHLSPKVEEYVCKKMGLKPARVSTQVIQRDRHAEFMSTLAVVGATLEKISVEIRHLQRTEVLEAEEYFSKGQKGSSAMPHKRNPVISERITGLARVLRANAIASLENVALWHERDISHSSVERIVMPDSCIALHYMLDLMIKLIKNLLVYPENMIRNLPRRARSVGGKDGWLIQGPKAWCTFAGRANVLALLARTDPDPAAGAKGLSLFIVPKEPARGHAFEQTQPGGGRLVGKADATPGYRGMHSLTLSIENWFVPKENLVGGEGGLGKGFYLQMGGFAAGRLQTGGRACGLAPAALEKACEYVLDRVQFGKPTVEYGLTQFLIA